MDEAHVAGDAEVAVAELGELQDLELLSALDWPPAAQGSAGEVNWFIVLTITDSIGPIRPGAEYGMTLSIEATGTGGAGYSCCLELAVPATSN